MTDLGLSYKETVFRENSLSLKTVIFCLWRKIKKASGGQMNDFPEAFLLIYLS